MRGSRVKNTVRELNNEKVDIIRWSSDPKEFVLEALKPAKVKNLVFDVEKKTATISVDEDQLSLAIGKKGQNARLTSRCVLLARLIRLRSRIFRQRERSFLSPHLHQPCIVGADRAAMCGQPNESAKTYATA